MRHKAQETSGHTPDKVRWIYLSARDQSTDLCPVSDEVTNAVRISSETPGSKLPLLRFSNEELKFLYKPPQLQP